MSFKDFYLSERAPVFADIENERGVEKGEWIDLSPRERNIVKANLYTMIQKSYTKALGEKHIRIFKQDDVIKDKELTFWRAVDIDKDPHADAVIFGQKRHGIKVSGFGHDGSKESINEMMDYLVKLLNDPSQHVWIEASGATERSLRKRGAHVITNKDLLEKIFKDSSFEFGVIPNHPKVRENPGEGWYKRIHSSGHEMIETAFGYPTE